MLIRKAFCVASLFAAVPALAEDLPNGWIEVPLGGETSCARGAPFSLFVNPGSGGNDKVVVDFVGGGACWSAETCAPESATFTDNMDQVRDYAASPSGIYDRSKVENPFREYTHVVVPYCTGDVHWGANDVTYTKANGETFEIRHRGAINARAAVDWVKANYAGQVQNLAVTGCSAGAYGSAYWTPTLREAFPQATIRQIGDAGVGILTPEFMEETFGRWNITANAPRWIPALDPAQNDWRSMTLADFYRGMARHYPEVQFSQFSAAFDFVQRLFYVRMGGDADLWGAQARTTLDGLDATLPNFRSYLAAGDLHCITTEQDFYFIESNGVRYRDWLVEYLAPNGDAPSSVRCEGTCEFK